MSSVVSWQLELNIKPGKLENLNTLVGEMSAYSREHEPGTLTYEWTRNSEGTECHIYERYRDSGALMAHIGAFQEHFAGRFFEILEIKRWTVYGNASAEVREALGGLGAEFYQSIGGFAR